MEEIICSRREILVFQCPTVSLHQFAFYVQFNVQVQICVRVARNNKLQLALIDRSDRFVDCVYYLLHTRLYRLRSKNIELGTHERWCFRHS